MFVFVVLELFSRAKFRNLIVKERAWFCFVLNVAVVLLKFKWCSLKLLVLLKFMVLTCVEIVCFVLAFVDLFWLNCERGSFDKTEFVSRETTLNLSVEKQRVRTIRSPNSVLELFDA